MVDTHICIDRRCFFLIRCDFFLIHHPRVCLSFSSFLLLFWSDSSPAARSVRFLAGPRLERSGWDCSRRSQSFEYGMCLLLVELDMSVSTVFPILCPCSRSFNALCMFASNCLLEMRNHGSLIELATNSSSCSVICRLTRAINPWRTYTLPTYYLTRMERVRPQGVEAIGLDLSKIDGWHKTKKLVQRDTKIGR